jgi:sterol 3beta-glucosyltransferase
MRALLLTVGSQGDVQPFVALASRLQADGHEAVLAAPALYGGLAAACDVPFVPLDLDLDALGAALAGRHGMRHLVTFCRQMGRATATLLPGAVAAAGLPGAALAGQRGAAVAGQRGAAVAGQRGVDLVVHHPVLPIGQHLAEFLGVPAVVAQPQPALVPTREFGSAIWPGRMPGVLNRPSYRAGMVLSAAWARRDLDRWRRDVLMLPPRPGRHDPLRAADGTPVPVLHAFSAHVVPPPADWPASAHVTGYWLLPTAPGWSPPRRLAEFLETGEPTVYLGFGSMPGPDPERLAAALMAAVRRAVVASSSLALRRLLPAGRFLVIRQAPHDWLFPRVQAVVHHGGAGTTGAAVAAGRPQVIWPFGVDQHFWARRMTGLGVAPSARPVRALTGPALAAALDQALGDRRLAAAAAELGQRVRAEDGCGTAVAQLEALRNVSPDERRLVADPRLAVHA